MKKTLFRIIMPACLLVLLLFVLFVINETAQVVGLAARLHPVLGTILLWLLIAVYAVLVAVPAVIYLRLPRALAPPASEESPEFPSYLADVKKRLAGNRHLTGMSFVHRGDIEAGLDALGHKADEVIRKAASSVFLSTAISQNGRLDAFLVLSAQSRMVWQIARIYYQRPAARQLLTLYTNVAATTFVAAELDDMDLKEQVEPVLTATFGALTGAIPGLQVAATVLVSSALTGAANAFLTLRVGIIAKRYCGSLVAVERYGLKRSASAEAAGMLGAIVREGSALVSKAVWEASKDIAAKTLSGMGEYVREKGASALAKLGVRRRRGTGDGQMDLL